MSFGKNNRLKKIINKTHQNQSSSNVDFDEDFLSAWHDNYGKPTSLLLEKVKNAGFHPIGITVMMCEETFIFKGKSEANEAAEMFLPEGWWYGLDDFYKDYDKHIHDTYQGDYEMGPIIYWLDKNFEPRN
ncbi:MAG: hypothetical protein ACOC22_03250 [bacterium]